MGEARGVRGLLAMGVLAAVLLFPLVSGLIAVLPGGWFSGLSGYVPFAANSLLWGVGIYFGLRWLGRRRRSQAGPVVSRTGSAPPS